jgi:hypothetical protein
VKTIEIEALAEAAPLVAVVQAWRNFKRWHDVEAASVCCCKHTRKLFDTLDELEKEILDL